MRDNKKILIALLALFVLSVYLPFLLWGGIIVDDWGDISEGLSARSFLDAYANWFPLFSNRPLAPLPIVLTTRLFGLWQHGYVAVNTGIYIAALGLISRVVHRRMGVIAAAVFFILAACPVIAPVIVFSPINQLTATVSMMFWGLSLTFLDLYLARPRWHSYLAAYLCLLYCFLTYEIILPLTAITLLLPLLATFKEAGGRRWARYAARYFLVFVAPVMLVLLTAYAWQRLIAPHFMAVYSRLNYSGWRHAQWVASMWWHAVTVDTGRLLIASLGHAPSTWLVAPLVLLGVILIRLLRTTPKVKSGPESSGFLIIAVLAFLSSSSLFFLTGSIAQVGGYESRGLSSSWLTEVLFFACAVQIWQYWQPRFFLKYRYGIAAGLFLVCALCLHSFGLQRENYIESWRLQNLILDDVIAQAHAKGFEAGQVVIGDVPYHLQSNYNDEVVFSQSWDFGDALTLRSDHFIKAGAVVNKDMQSHDYVHATDDEIVLDGWWKEKIAALWYYRFDPVTGIGTLARIRDADDLRQRFTQILN